MSNQQDNKKPFNPMDHLMTIPGKGNKEYLEVKWRMVWFRLECPQGTIDTEEIEVDLDREVEDETSVWSNEKKRSEKVIKHGKGYARFRAVVNDGKGGRATGTKSENAAGFSDFIEKAETGAIGRALAVLGYGTQFAPDFQEGLSRIVDSPVNLPQDEPKNDERKDTASASSSKAQAPAPPAVTTTPTTPAAPRRAVTPTMPSEPRKEKLVSQEKRDEITKSYKCLVGPHEWKALLTDNKLPQDDKTWTETQALGVVTACEKWMGSPEQEAWLGRTILRDQLKDFDRLAELYGVPAVKKLRDTIESVSGKSTADMTRQQADTFLAYLLEVEPVFAKAQTVDPTFEVARTFKGVTHILDFVVDGRPTSEGTIDDYRRKLEEIQAKKAA